MTPTPTRPDPLRPLLERVLAQGDEAAAETLLARTRPRLLAIARRAGRAQDAEDTVQVAWVSLLARRDGVPPGPVMGWLVTAVVRIAWRRNATARKHRDLAERLARQGPPSAAIPDTLEQRELRRDLRRAVEDLPSPYRDVMVLHHLEGLSQRDVARLLDVPHATVRTHLHRGRKMLRGRLSRRLHHMLGVLSGWLPGGLGNVGSTGGLLMGKNMAWACGAVALLLVGGLWWTETWPFSGGEASDAGSPANPEAPVELAGADPVTDPSAASLEGRPGDPATDPVPWRGRVLDVAGQPIPTATVLDIRTLRTIHGVGDVVLWQRDGALADGDPVAADGSFAISLRDSHRGPDADLEGREIQLLVQARAPGFLPRVARVSPGTRQDIRLERGHALEVHVVDAHGRPVADAEGVLVPEGRLSVTRAAVPPTPAHKQPGDSQGRLTFLVAPGTWSLRVTAPGHAPRDVSPIDLNAAPTDPLEVALDTGLQVRLRLTDDQDVPIRGARIHLGAPLGQTHLVRTDAQGHAQVTGIHPAPTTRGPTHSFWAWRLFYRVFAEGHAPLTGSVALPAGETRHTLPLRLSRGVPVRVRFVDQDGAPVTGGLRASVAAFSHLDDPLHSLGDLATGSPDPEGWVDLGRLSADHRHVVIATADAALDAEPRVALPVGTEPLEHVIPVTRRRVDGVLVGRVVWPDGRPVSNARLTFEGSSTVANDQGEFRLEDLPRQEGTLWVQSPWILRHALATVDTRGATADRTWTLDPAGRIQGRLETRDGDAVGDVTLTFSATYVTTTAQGAQAHQSLQVGRVTTDSEGRYEVWGVPGGQGVRVHLGRDEASTAWVSSHPWPRLVRGRASGVVHAVKPASEGKGIPVAVRVRTADGPYVGPVRFSWHREGQGPYLTSEEATEQDGIRTWRLWTPPGRYRLTLQVAGYLDATTPELRLEDRADPPVVDVLLERGARLRLRVVDESDRPVRAQALQVNLHWKGGSTGAVLRTDDAGILDWDGHPPGRTGTLWVSSQSDPAHVKAKALEDVSAPSEVRVVLRRRGVVRVRGPGTRGEVSRAAVWRLLDAAGTEVARRTWTPDPSRAGQAALPLSGWMEIAEDGTYTVEADVDGRILRKTVRATVGHTVQVDF